MFFYNSSIDFEAHFRHKGFFAESDLKNRARGFHATKKDIISVESQALARLADRLRIARKRFFPGSG